MLQQDCWVSNTSRFWEEPYSTCSAPLVNLTVCIRDDQRDDLSEIPIVCAVTDLCASDYDVILPADVVRELQAASVVVNVSSCDLGVVCDVGTETSDPEVEDNTPEDVDSLPVGGVEAHATALLMEQEQGPTMATCWDPGTSGQGWICSPQGLTLSS